MSRLWKGIIIFMKLIITMIQGFCMALADSVPGVSGGTIAFIMGFYDKFIGSIHDIAFKKGEDRKNALYFLIKLGLGWIVGMALAALVLSSLFESHIYVVSSLFIGFIAGAVPLIVKEEKESCKDVGKGILFAILGIMFVVGLTWLNGRIEATSDLAVFSVGLGIKLFFIGMFAISAMFLPGISGSTLLLVFGVYMPIMAAIKEILHFNLAYFPALFVFGLGIIFGALTVVKVIKVCLDKFRTQTVYMILGMMLGSFYAIVMGPTTLKNAMPAMRFDTFHIIACIAGLALVLGMQFVKSKGED